MTTDTQSNAATVTYLRAKAVELRERVNADFVALDKALNGTRELVTTYLLAQAQATSAAQGEQAAIDELINIVRQNRSERSGGPLGRQNVQEALKQEAALHLLGSRYLLKPR